MKTVFHPDSYDKQLCLKPSVIMILAMVYSIRHVLMVFLAYFPAMGGNSDTNVIKAMLSPQLLIADLPALLILVSWNFRQPLAGKFWRLIWRFGRLLLLISLTAQLVLLSVTDWADQLINTPESDESTLVIIYMLVHLYVMAYVVLSERLKAVFLDFPKPDADKNQPAKPNIPPRLASPETNPTPPVFAELADPDAEQQALRLKAAINQIRPGHEDQIEPFFQSLQDNTPQSAAIWHELGLQAVKQNKLEEAALLVTHSSLLAPTNPLYLRNLCEILRRMGRLDAALHAAHKAIQLQPNDADAYYNQGLVFAGLNRTGSAIGSYEAALRINPAHGNAWNNLGVLLRHKGDHTAAQHAFQQALTNLPDNTEAQKNLAAVTAHLQAHPSPKPTPKRT